MKYLKYLTQVQCEKCGDWGVASDHGVGPDQCQCTPLKLEKQAAELHNEVAKQIANSTVLNAIIWSTP
jgi:hypothetical protein